MYVKVIFREKTDIFEVADSELSTGLHTFFDGVTAEQVMAHLELDPPSTVVRFLADETEPSFISEGQQGWIMSYAYWWDWDKGFLRLVVTQGKIYVLGDNGKTIDKVA